MAGRPCANADDVLPCFMPSELRVKRSNSLDAGRAYFSYLAGVIQCFFREVVEFLLNVLEYGNDSSNRGSPSGDDAVYGFVYVL